MKKKIKEPRPAHTYRAARRNATRARTPSHGHPFLPPMKFAVGWLTFVGAHGRLA